jgi:uncharacterized protein YjeT (DUF2065 family)
MQHVVSAVGILIVLAGLAILVVPGKWKKVFLSLAQGKFLYFAAAFRIIVGVLFILAAETTRTPMAVKVIGALIIVAGVMIPIVGPKKLALFIQLMLARKDSTLRLFGVVAGAIGVFFIWTAN